MSLYTFIGRIRALKSIPPNPKIYVIRMQPLDPHPNPSNMCFDYSNIFLFRQYKYSKGHVGQLVRVKNRCGFSNHKTREVLQYLNNRKGEIYIEKPLRGSRQFYLLKQLGVNQKWSYPCQIVLPPSHFIQHCLTQYKIRC